MNQNILDSLCAFVADTKKHNAYDIYNDWAKENKLLLGFEKATLYVGYINRFLYIKDVYPHLYKNTVDYIKKEMS